MSSYFKCLMISNAKTNPGKPSALKIKALVACDRVYINGVTSWRKATKPRIIPIVGLAFNPKIRPLLSSSLIGTLMSNCEAFNTLSFAFVVF